MNLSKSFSVLITLLALTASIAQADGIDGFGLVTATDSLEAKDENREYAVAATGTHAHVADNKYNAVGSIHARLELGNRGLGLTGTIRENRAEYFSKFLTDVGLSPFFSYGPDLSFRTHSNHNDYIDLTLGGTIGLMLESDSCRAAAGVRAGLDWGTLGSNGLRPAVGAMAVAKCPGFLQLATEYNLLIENDKPGSREIAADLTGQVGRVQLGGRYEQVRDSNSNDESNAAEQQIGTEHRFMIQGSVTHDLL
ncbi:MAG TPA: hypothetical protein PLH57_09535 [Oligoflexia bacterium]|nr:hypothetical protein [Oligoflexia bacterium]